MTENLQSIFIPLAKYYTKKYPYQVTFGVSMFVLNFIRLIYGPILPPQVLIQIGESRLILIGKLIILLVTVFWIYAMFSLSKYLKTGGNKYMNKFINSTVVVSFVLITSWSLGLLRYGLIQLST